MVFPSFAQTEPLICSNPRWRGHHRLHAGRVLSSPSDLPTSDVFLLPSLRRFQFRAHRRHTDLRRHEAGVAIGDRYMLILL
jgi:hypothetical protein